MSKGARTKETILRAAFELTYIHGYQNTSIDDILKKTHVTKGSFFYHFKNKDEMGLAMINQVMYPGMKEAMVTPLLDSKAPIEELKVMMKGLLLTNPFFDVRYGCPAVNLIQEMASVSESFNKALSKLTDEWKLAIEQTLQVAKKDKLIGKDRNCEEIALHIISGYNGIRNLGKIYGRESYNKFIREFNTYLDLL